MAAIPARPSRGDIITLEAPRERSRVAVVVGVTATGALRVRLLSATAVAATIRSYRGSWRPLPVTDPRHPAFDPADPSLLAELGL